MTSKFTYKTRGIGDLVKHEPFPYIGYTREEITVASTPGATLPMGSLVFRAIADTPGNYTPFTNVNQLVGTNEFAITLGDTLGEVLDLVIPAAGAEKCAAVARGHIILADKYVFDVIAASGVTLDANAKAKLVHLLKKQNIILELTV